MSVISRAQEELDLINFGPADSAVMIAIMRAFFGQWDSGGAVSVAAPVLQRLLAGKPLSPITDEAAEWDEVENGVFQHRRCSTVFRGGLIRDGKIAYDIDNPKGAREPITFPYFAP